MKFTETLNECWILLKNELSKEKIDSIEKFMSYIFSDLFQLLNNENKIDNYESLIKFENILESNIQQIVKKYKNFSMDNSLKKGNNEDKTSFICLLKERYTDMEYDKKEFPFYKYFYYTDYLNEKYIEEKLSHMDERNYPVLKQYLESKKNQPENYKYSLNNLNLFNSILNLINEKYSYKISRELAEKKD